MGRKYAVALFGAIFALLPLLGGCDRHYPACAEKPAELERMDAHMAEGAVYWLQCSRSMTDCDSARDFDMLRLKEQREHYSRATCLEQDGTKRIDDPNA